MQTAIEKKDEFNRVLTVHLPLTQLTNKVDSALKKMATTIKMDGFRPGKIPMDVITTKYGEAVKQEQANQLVQETLYQAFHQEKISPAAMPVIERIDYQDNEMIYQVAFDVFPEVELADMTALKVEKIVSELTKEDTDKALLRLQENVADYKPSLQKSALGDRLTIDFVGFIDGKAFQGGDAKDFQLVLGKKTMIDGFESGLIGFNVGDHVALNLTFPSTYHVSDLAAKAVTFKVDIKAVDAVVLATLDDELAKKYNEKSIDSLTENLKKHMTQELTDQLRVQNKEKLFDALLDAHKISLPERSIAEEAQRLLEDFEKMMAEKKTPMPEKPEIKLFEAQADKRLKLGLLIGKIVSDNQLTVTDDDIDNYVKENTPSQDETQQQQMIATLRQDRDRMENIRSLLLEQKVVDLILGQAKVTTVNKVFAEIVR